MFIVYQINLWSFTRECALGIFLFRAVKLTTIADADKHKYAGYCVGFNTWESFAFVSGFGRNVIIFVADEFIWAC